MGSGKDGFWTPEECEYYLEEVRQMKIESGELRKQGIKPSRAQSTELAGPMSNDECARLAKELQKKKHELWETHGFHQDLKVKQDEIARRDRWRDDDQ